MNYLNLKTNTTNQNSIIVNLIYSCITHQWQMHMQPKPYTLNLWLL